MSYLILMDAAMAQQTCAIGSVLAADEAGWAAAAMSAPLRGGKGAAAAWWVNPTLPVEANFSCALYHVKSTFRKIQLYMAAKVDFTGKVDFSCNRAGQL